MTPLRIRTLQGRYAVCRLDAAEPLPAWASGDLVSITRTAGELSVICDESAAPEGVRAERGWRALQVDGPLPFEMTGVAAALTQPLAAAGVSLLLVSTFDTDILLVKDAALDRAFEALRAAGFDLV
jgi:hypothetical protein